MKKRIILLSLLTITAPVVAVATYRQPESINEYLEKNSNASASTLISEISKQLQAGKDINAQTSQGDSPLLTAIILGREDVAKFLIDREARLDIKNYAGKSALDLAREQNMQSVVRMIETRIDAYQRPPRSRKPLKGLAVALPA
jgi:ankyrin repeat protein